MEAGFANENMVSGLQYMFINQTAQQARPDIISDDPGSRHAYQFGIDNLDFHF
ncbi:MAG: hypothetical protein BWY65_01563 [Firmicutes bacterium ADurb.Bin373]|nr:MAG: hypothetical protein BWY65_01563 [Firmicutes bacterium ADurb.Bin373]